MNRRILVMAILAVVVAVNVVVVIVAVSRGDGDLAGAVQYGPVSVTLIDPGASPRHELRYDAEPGSTMGWTAAVRMEASLQPNAGLPSVPFPAVELSMITTVESETADDFRVATRYMDYRWLDDGSPFQTVESDAELQRLLAGASVTQTVDRSGRMVAGSERFLPTTTRVGPPALGDALYLLPTEPVGVGAVWEVRGEATRSGMTTLTLATFELTDVRDDHFMASISVWVRLLDGHGTRIDGVQIMDVEEQHTGEVTWYPRHAMALMSSEGTSTMTVRSSMQDCHTGCKVTWRIQNEETRR